jgi:hypothetical protein
MDTPLLVGRQRLRCRLREQRVPDRHVVVAARKAGGENLGRSRAEQARLGRTSQQRKRCDRVPARRTQAPQRCRHAQAQALAGLARLGELFEQERIAAGAFGQPSQGWLRQPRMERAGKLRGLDLREGFERQQLGSGRRGNLQRCRRLGGAPADGDHERDPPGQ